MGQRFFLRTLPMVRLSDRDRTSRTDDSAGTADASVFQGIAGCRPTACPAFEQIGSIGPRLSETAWLLKIADLELWMGDPMWEQLKRTDIELAKQKLEAFRSMTLSRHADELKDLDAQRDDIETLERLAEAVASRYLNAESSSTQPSRTQPISLLCRRPGASALTATALVNCRKLATASSSDRAVMVATTGIPLAMSAVRAVIKSQLGGETAGTVTPASDGVSAKLVRVQKSRRSRRYLTAAMAFEMPSRSGTPAECRVVTIPASSGPPSGLY